jgi:alpha-amylase
LLKRLLSVFLIFSVVFLSGCSWLSDGNSDGNKDPKPDEYNVPSNGGALSSDDLIYFIMTDRFFDGDESNNTDIDRNNLTAYHGGDFKGIIKKLDYIKSLGATAIWITPIAENEFGGYHGYWAQDFYKVDPRLGTMEELKELVKSAQGKGIKVIVDYVVNHTGYKHQWLNEPDYKSWFNPNKSINNSNRESVERGWLAGLPDLNHDIPEVRDYFIENALWWIRETGMDGMRLDTVKHVPKDFWADFAQAIKSEFPDFFFIGEVWVNSPSYLASYNKVGIDSLANFPIYNGIRDTFKTYGKTDPLISAIKGDERAFDNPQLNGIFIDNHDVARHISSSGEDGEQHLKQALAFLMTYRGVPILYYGTEIAMEGRGDPDNRRYMDWAKTDDSSILNYYRDLVSIRHKSKALTQGTIEILDNNAKFFSFKREHQNDFMVIAFNIENKEKIESISIEGSFTDLLTGETIESEGQGIKLNLRPYQVVILKKTN